MVMVLYLSVRPGGISNVPQIGLPGDYADSIGGHGAIRGNEAHVTRQNFAPRTGTNPMTNTSLEDQNAKSLGRAMKSAIETLRPHYSQRAIAAKLDLGKKRDDWRTGEKPKAKALRDFLNQKRTSKRLSYVWINFAYEIMELLFKNSDRDAAVLAEARVFSAVLEKYLLKFHSLDAKHFLVPPNLGESNYRFRMPRVEFGVDVLRPVLR